MFLGIQTAYCEIMLIKDNVLMDKVSQCSPMNNSQLGCRVLKGRYFFMRISVFRDSIIPFKVKVDSTFKVVFSFQMCSLGDLPQKCFNLIGIFKKHNL